MDTPPFPGIVTDVDDLESVYGPPVELVRKKAIDHLDTHCRAFIERSPFLAIAAADGAGVVDVSPRGGPAGFVRVLDPKRVVVPDATGNRTLDILHRVVSGGRVGLLFVIPGLSETLRIRGDAYVTRDPALLDGLETGGKPARLGIGIVVETAFLHCAKAFIRSDLWRPDRWPDTGGLAKPAQIFADHAALPEYDAGSMQALLDDEYLNQL
jgi:PPOX class probable FMN-dependent enzyme